jgi:ABC-type transport system substrate-binding protein
MNEHPAVTVAKVGLLAVVAVLLLFTFIAQNETQDKVIRTADRLDELGDQVAEVKRLVVAGGGRPTSREPAAAVDYTKPRTPGWTVLLTPEEDPPRPPDEEIDFDAELRYPLPLEPKGMNLITSDRDRYVATELGFYVYGQLAERKNSSKDRFKPALAEWAESSPDHREFRIWLRPGLQWHRPPVNLTEERYGWMRGDHPVTTADLVFALDMIFDTRADTGNIRAEFEGIEDYRAEDPQVLRVRYKEANFYAAAALFTTLAPMPRWIYEREEDGSRIDAASLGQRFGQHWFNKKMCGCGPYVFKEYKQSDYIRLERNEDYWGRRPAFKSIFYKLNIQEDEKRYNVFMHRDETGNRDAHFYPCSPTRWKREVLEGDGTSPLLDPTKAMIHQYQRMMFAYTGWACRNRLFQDPLVRRAMTLAANRAKWMTETFVGIAVNPSGPAFVDAPEYDRSIAPWPHDLEEAARLLEEAGWVDRDGNGVREKQIDGETVEFRFTLLDQAGGSPEIDATRSDWIESLRKIGVIATPNPVEWNEWIKRARDRDFQAIFAAWSLEDDFRPSNTFHGRQIEVPGSYNYVEWSHPRANEVIDLLEVTFDLDTRYRLCHEFHEIFHEEQPYTITWSWRNPVVHDAHIGGILDRPFTPQVDWRDMYWVKEGTAKYTDGRDRGKGWMRKKDG